MIDEQSKRKGNFDEKNSGPVIFADGQTWHVPKPWLEVRPVFRGGRAVSAYRALTCGPELDALIDAAAESESLDVQVVAAATLGAHLLLWQYELSDEELDRLLAFRISDPASLQWMRDLFSLATGQSGPKA